MDNRPTHTPFLMNLSILIVDDDEIILEAIKLYVQRHGGIPFAVRKISQAVHLIETHQFDVALIDILLNGEGSGFDLMKQCKRIDPEITVILMTGKHIEDMISDLLAENVYAVIPKPYDPLSLGLILLQASRNTRDFRRSRYISDNLREKVNIVQMERDKIFFNTLLSLSNALEQKDEYTRNHSEMVGNIAEKIAIEYSTDSSFIEDVAIAGRLHDLGKIGIRDDILFKKGPLTDAEHENIMHHPEMSYKIIKPVDSKGVISSFVLHHHERWNGEGYPHHLKEKCIPSGSRILAVADTFNALTSNRPYREAQDVAFAIQILQEGSAILFDPEIVEIFNRLVRIGRIVL